jgi:hypothetical protein
MRQISTVFSVLFLASSAFAGASQSHAAQPINLATVPERCQPVAEVPHSARTAEPALSARVSAASCMAEQMLAGLPLTDDDASIQRANEATAPIIATLDEVIAEGDPSAQLVAAYTKGDLLFGLQQRMREAVPPMTSRMTLASVKDIEQRHRALEPKLSPWRRAGTVAFLRVLATARDNPKLSNGNPVVQYMIRDAERRISAVGTAS